MHLLVALEQAGPVLGLQLLLSQDHLDIGRSVVGLGVVDINLTVELDVKVVGGLLGI